MGGTKNSIDYAGYQVGPVAKGTVSLVGGTFPVPQNFCHKGSPGGFAEYVEGVKVGGGGESSFFQDGLVVEFGCNGNNLPFYILGYVNNTVQFTILNKVVHGGDNVRGMLTINSHHLVTITINDLTRGWAFVASWHERTSANTSAFWGIVDFPFGFTLPNFGNFKVSGVEATISGHKGAIGSFISNPSFIVTRYQMTDFSQRVKAFTSSLSSGSTGFSITWKSAT